MKNFPHLNFQLPKQQPFHHAEINPPPPVLPQVNLVQINLPQINLPPINFPPMPRAGTAVGNRAGSADAGGVTQSMASGLGSSSNLSPLASEDVTKVLEMLPSVLDLVSLLTGFVGIKHKEEGGRS